jgi:transcription antitermination factor NusG
MTERWYALRSKPHKEDLLWEQLEIRAIESFFPRLRVQTVNPRARKVKPYFPGYVFVRADLEVVNPSSLQWAPGAVGLVTFGDQPAWVPDDLIAAIRRRVDEVNKAGGELLEGLKPGETVTIQDGPFSGYEAIFDTRLPGSERVRVLLKLLGHKQLPLEMPAGQVRRKERSK